MSLIHQAFWEVWEIVKPYLIELAAHFAIFCFTMIALVLMLAISRWVISFCERRFKEDPLVIKALVYSSDLLIIVHFAWYLFPICS